jgi:hypothetical protein
MNMGKGYDYDDLFPGRFLKAADFKGAEVTMTIASVVIEDLPDKKGTKVNADGERVRTRGIIGFTKSDGTPIQRALVLNRTNGECLKKLFGRNTADWIGKRVTFFPRMVDAFGEQTNAIRIKGAPHLDAPLQFTARIGRQDRTFTLVPTGKRAATNGRAAAPPPPAPEPPPPSDPVDGLPTDDEPPPGAETDLDDFEKGFGSQAQS